MVIWYNSTWTCSWSCPIFQVSAYESNLLLLFLLNLFACVYWFHCELRVQFFPLFSWMQVLLMTLQNAPPGLDYERDKRFSKVCGVHSKLCITCYLERLFIYRLYFLSVFQRVSCHLFSQRPKEASKFRKAFKASLL